MEENVDSNPSGAPSEPQTPVCQELIPNASSNNDDVVEDRRVGADVDNGGNDSNGSKGGVMGVVGDNGHQAGNGNDGGPPGHVDESHAGACALTITCDVATPCDGAAPCDVATPCDVAGPCDVANPCDVAGPCDVATPCNIDAECTSTAASGRRVDRVRRDIGGTIRRRTVIPAIPLKKQKERWAQYLNKLKPAKAALDFIQPEVILKEYSGLCYGADGQLMKFKEGEPETSAVSEVNMHYNATGGGGTSIGGGPSIEHLNWADLDPDIIDAARLQSAYCPNTVNNFLSGNEYDTGFQPENYFMPQPLRNPVRPMQKKVPKPNRRAILPTVKPDDEVIVISSDSSDEKDANDDDYNFLHRNRPKNQKKEVVMLKASNDPSRFSKNKPNTKVCRVTSNVLKLQEAKNRAMQRELRHSGYSNFAYVQERMRQQRSELGLGLGYVNENIELYQPATLANIRSGGRSVYGQEAFTQPGRRAAYAIEGFTQQGRSGGTNEGFTQPGRSTYTNGQPRNRSVYTNDRLTQPLSNATYFNEGRPQQRNQRSHNQEGLTGRGSFQSKGSTRRVTVPLPIQEKATKQEMKLGPVLTDGTLNQVSNIPSSSKAAALKPDVRKLSLRPRSGIPLQNLRLKSSSSKSLALSTIKKEK